MLLGRRHISTDQIVHYSLLEYTHIHEGSRFCFLPVQQTAATTYSRAKEQQNQHKTSSTSSCYDDYGILCEPQEEGGTLCNHGAVRCGCGYCVCVGVGVGVGGWVRVCTHSDCNTTRTSCLLYLYTHSDCRMNLI